MTCCSQLTQVVVTLLGLAVSPSLALLEACKVIDANIGVVRFLLLATLDLAFCIELLDINIQITDKAVA